MCAAHEHRFLINFLLLSQNKSPGKRSKIKKDKKEKENQSKHQTSNNKRVFYIFIVCSLGIICCTIIFFQCSLRKSKSTLFFPWNFWFMTKANMLWFCFRTKTHILGNVCNVFVWEPLTIKEYTSTVTLRWKKKSFFFLFILISTRKEN